MFPEANSTTLMEGLAANRRASIATRSSNALRELKGDAWPCARLKSRWSMEYGRCEARMRVYAQRSAAHSILKTKGCEKSRARASIGARKDAEPFRAIAA